MKKLLAITTALALVGGGGKSLAEITTSGGAKLRVDLNSISKESESTHSFRHEMGVDVSSSGTTDGGVSFGGPAGFDTGADATNGCDFPIAATDVSMSRIPLMPSGGRCDRKSVIPRNFGPERRIFPAAGRDSRFVPGDAGVLQEQKPTAPGTGAEKGALQ